MIYIIRWYKTEGNDNSWNESYINIRKPRLTEKRDRRKFYKRNDNQKDVRMML